MRYEGRVHGLFSVTATLNTYISTAGGHIGLILLLDVRDCFTLEQQLSQQQYFLAWLLALKRPQLLAA